MWLLSLTRPRPTTGPALGAARVAAPLAAVTAFSYVLGEGTAPAPGCALPAGRADPGGTGQLSAGIFVERAERLATTSGLIASTFPSRVLAAPHPAGQRCPHQYVGNRILRA